jgi:hypothetical protein
VRESPDFLDHVARRLATVWRLEDVQQIVRVAARKLVRAQGATFVLGRPSVIPDTEQDERIPQETYRPTFVRA